MTVQHSTLSYVAGVELVKQGDVEIGAHQQAETDLSKVAPFLLVVTRLREFRRPERVNDFATPLMINLLCRDLCC